MIAVSWVSPATRYFCAMSFTCLSTSPLQPLLGCFRFAFVSGGLEALKASSGNFASMTILSSLPDSLTTQSGRMPLLSVA